MTNLASLSPFGVLATNWRDKDRGQVVASPASELFPPGRASVRADTDTVVSSRIRGRRCKGCVQTIEFLVLLSRKTLFLSKIFASSFES
jgi:hypothetical protein